MNRFTLLIVLLAPLGCGMLAYTQQPPATTTAKPSDADPADLKALAQGNNEFAFDLYRQLSQKEKGNLVFSPYSISTALAMTYAGARGETAAQMKKVLHFTLGQKGTHPAFANLNGQLLGDGKERPYQLHVANALWGQKGLSFQPDFLQLTHQCYGAGLKEVDFVRDAEDARQLINRWVEEQTQDKIKELLPKGALNEKTRLVLTNAIYFKADWLYPFKKEATKDELFRVSAQETLDVPMMHQEGFFRYRDLGTAQMLDLPYKGCPLSLVILLPKKVDGLVELERSLTAAHWQKWRAQPSPAFAVPFPHPKSEPLMLSPKVKVIMPKFKVTAAYSLSKQLAALGMPQAFSRDADFSGMVREDTRGDRIKLKVSAVIHKAHVAVDEQGTEAAAATAVIVGVPFSMPVEFPVYVTVRADHPFVYLIQDNSTGSILFLGRMVNPKE